jgi:hypothetical protein
MAFGTALGTAYTQTAAAPDYLLRIAPLRLELAPGKVIDTFGYNGSVPSSPGRIVCRRMPWPWCRVPAASTHGYTAALC